MPELPEVETVVLGLQKLVQGHVIEGVKTDWPKSLRISESAIKENVLGQKIIGLRRVGKMILIDLHGGNTLVVHLKMTGQLVYRRVSSKGLAADFGAGHPSDSLISQLPDKTTRVVFTLDRQATLYFNDMRKFGWIKILSSNNIIENRLIKQLGPDALEVERKEFVQILSERRKGIKACLLDQTIIAGCGNIYADEALWASKIHPGLLACELRARQLSNLHSKLQSILRLSISKGGSSSRNYVNALGQKGKYLDFVQVYQRKGLPCARCKHTIERIVVANRGTHICPVCQKV